MKNSRKKVADIIDWYIKNNKKAILESKDRMKKNAFGQRMNKYNFTNHKPVYATHDFHPGEFRVFLDSSYKVGFLNEAFEFKYPATLPSRAVIKEVNERITDFVIYCKGSYLHKNDEIATAITVNIPEYQEYSTDDTILTTVDEIFRACGYFRSTPDVVFKNAKTGDSDGMRVLQYEAYHYENSKRLTVPNTIYHVTTPDCKDGILKDGFIASCRPNVEWIQYPSRNYFFIKADINLMDDYMRKAQKITPENGNAVLFHVDTRKLKDIKFYSDPQFAERQAIYTYDDIPASAIINVVEADWNIDD